MVWAALGKAAMGGLKAGTKKVATDKLLNRKKKTNKRRASVKKIMGVEDKEKEGVREQKGGALAVRPSMGLVPDARDLNPVSTTPGESDIIIIKKQVIQVRDILKDTQSAKQAERNNLRKAKQLDKKKKEEDKIEKPKAKPKESKGGMTLPKTGLGIGNFLTWLAAGVIFGKLNELMPAIRKILKTLRPIANFIGGLFEKTIGFVVGFIDITYGAIEKLEEAITAIGGEGAGELFQKFGKLFTQVLNGALIAALVASRGGLFKKPKGPKGPTPKWKKRLNRWFKKTGPGKFLRNQKARVLKLVRSISKGPLGKVAKVLNPKNISKWINTGGVDKALKGGVKNVINFAKKVKPLETIQNLTKKIKPVETLQKLNPFKGMDLGKKASNLMTRGKNFGGKILSGAKGLHARLSKNILTIFKQGTNLGRKIGQGFTNLSDKVNPQKVIKNLRTALKGQLDELIKKNTFVKQIHKMMKNPGGAKKSINNLINKAAKFKPLNKLIKTLSKSKATKGLGPLEKIITALSAIIDYAAGESPINAILKAMGGLLGYTAGFAAASAVPVLGQSGVFNFAGGMMGGMLGDMLANKLAGVLAKSKLGEIPDPLQSDGRMLVRDPSAPFQPKKSKEDGGEAMSDARSEMKEKIERIKNRKKYGGTGGPIEYDGKVYKPGDEGYAAIVKSVTSAVSGSSSEGLDTTPSYGSGGFVRVDTEIYIQPVEV